MLKRKTPLHEARNLGELSAAELNAVGFESLEDLQATGWEEVCIRWVESYPERLNLNAFAALIGAIEGVDWRSITDEQRAEAKRLKARLSREFEPPLSSKARSRTKKNQK